MLRIGCLREQPSVDGLRLLPGWPLFACRCFLCPDGPLYIDRHSLPLSGRGSLLPLLRANRNRHRDFLLLLRFDCRIGYPLL